MKVRAVGEGQSCTVTVNGTVVHDDSQLAALDRPPGRGVVLDTGRDTPYRCVGGTIVRLQRAGFRVLAVTADGVPLPGQ